jgi:hypothetical protein
MPLAVFSAMDTGCPICKGLLWLCEEHPTRGWPHDDCPGPGFPCKCNSTGRVEWAEVFASVDEPPPPEEKPPSVH